MLPFGPPFTNLYIWKLNHGLYKNVFAQMKNFIVKKKEDKTPPPQSGAQNMLQPGQ
jgi:hypothetical protein